MKSRKQEMFEHLVKTSPKLAIEFMKLHGMTGQVTELYSDVPKLHINHRISKGREVGYEIYYRSGKLMKRA